jgi:hypothetical protein
MHVKPIGEHPDKDEVRFKPSQAHQIALGVTLLIMGQIGGPAMPRRVRGLDGQIRSR